MTRSINHLHVSTSRAAISIVGFVLGIHICAVNVARAQTQAQKMGADAVCPNDDEIERTLAQQLSSRVQLNQEHLIDRSGKPIIRLMAGFEVLAATELPVDCSRTFKGIQRTGFFTRPNYEAPWINAAVALNPIETAPARITQSNKAAWSSIIPKFPGKFMTAVRVEFRAHYNFVGAWQERSHISLYMYDVASDGRVKRADKVATVHAPLQKLSFMPEYHGPGQIALTVKVGEQSRVILIGPNPVMEELVQI